MISVGFAVTDNQNMKPATVTKLVIISGTPSLAAPARDSSNVAILPFLSPCPVRFSEARGPLR